MVGSDFDPKKFIDREFEQELFENLLQFKDCTRILAIEDAGGMGKSHLLRKLQYRCRTVKPRTPVSLIVLHELPDNKPLTLVEAVQKDLVAFKLKFPEFTKYNSARTSGDFSTIRIYLQGSIWRGAEHVEIAGSIQKYDQVNKVVYEQGGAPTPLTGDLQVVAQDVCVNAFLDDLHQICSQRPVVIMLDAFERCPAELRDWSEEEFLERCFFDLENRPECLLLVVAGREKIPEFHLRWPEEDCEAVVTSVKGLGKWKKKHVEECLRVHGFDYEPKDVDAFYRLIEIGHPPSTIVQLITQSPFASG